MKFEFTDKASYLLWRQAWKADYAELSQRIRELKRGRKTWIDHYRYEMTERGRSRVWIGRDPNPFCDQIPGCQTNSYGLDLKGQARFQMERLTEAKALSWALKRSLNAA